MNVRKWSNSSIVYTMAQTNYLTWLFLYHAMPFLSYAVNRVTRSLLMGSWSGIRTM